MKSKICIVAALALVLVMMMIAGPVWNQPKPVNPQRYDAYWEGVSSRHFAYYVAFWCGVAEKQGESPPPDCRARHGDPDPGNGSPYLALSAR